LEDENMRFISSFLVKASLAILIATTTCASDAEPVCRSKYISGMETRIDRVGHLLGNNTVRVDELKLYVGVDDGVPFIQSNYLSAEPEHAGLFSPYPTKLRSSEITDIKQALKNVIFWSELPDNADVIVADALRKVTIYIDAELIRANGETTFDVSSARNFKIVRQEKVVETGEISLLPLTKPPPALTEIIRGCCLKGRPPGNGKAIITDLQNREFNPGTFGFLPLVSDSGTHTVVNEQPVLRKAVKRTVNLAGNYESQLTEALQRSRGKTLVVLAHIEKTDVVVQGGNKTSAFSIPIETLRSRSKAADVDLILLGCDTASVINEATGGIGVLGTFDSVKVTRMLERAIPLSRNIADLVERLASKDLTMVAYMEKGGHGSAGATAFAKVRGKPFLVRVFRILALREWSLNGTVKP
jgi:hypothetical protein